MKYGLPLGIAPALKLLDPDDSELLDRRLYALFANETVASNVLINSSVSSGKTITPVANLSPNLNYPINLELLNKIFGGSWNAYNLLDMQHNLSYGINSIVIENVTNASGYKMAIAILNLSNVSFANSAYNLLSSSSDNMSYPSALLTNIELLPV